MPYVLEQSLREVYVERGWNLADNSNRRGAGSPRQFPTLSDLVARVRTVTDRLGYDERLCMDVKAGLVARLDQLRSGGGKGPMLDTRTSVPAAVLFGSPCVLELKQVVDDDEKAFLIGLILIRLYEHYEGGQGQAAPARHGLRHVTLIEEAHRLLRNVSTEQGGEVAANPKGRAIEVFANFLAEIRAYGESLIISEQVPVKLVPDALKNTNLKVVHRLVAEDDRKAVGATMNLNEAQMRHLTTLHCGEAVAYAEGRRQPVLVRVPPSAAKRGVHAVTNDAVRQAEGVQALWRAQPLLRLPLPACRACPAAVPGTSCGARNAERADPEVRAAFRRLWHALWLAPEAAAGAYDEFRAACLRQPQGGRGSSPYCLFAELAEYETEQRGAFHGWPHGTVDRVVALACELARRLEGRSGAAPVASRRPLKEVRREFAALLTDLHRTDHLPYAGCAGCPRRCSYRFDLAHPEKHPEVRAFREAFQIEDVESRKAVLLEVCRAVAAETFPADAEVRREAAACFAAQQFHREGLAPEDQRISVAWVREQIAVDEPAETLEPEEEMNHRGTRGTEKRLERG